MPESRKKPIRFSAEQERLIRELMSYTGVENFSAFLKQCVGSLKMQVEMIKPTFEAYNYYVKPFDDLFEKEFHKHPEMYVLWKERKEALDEFYKFTEGVSDREADMVKPLFDNKVGAKKKLRKRGRPKN